MRNLAIFLVFTAILLTACGESHTYTGVLKRTGIGSTEGKVNITIVKESETDATMTIKNDGAENPGLFLTECTYPIKLQRRLSDGNYWNADSCYLKDRSVSLTTSAENLTFGNKQMKMKVTTDLATDRETRFEFEGTEK